LADNEKIELGRRAKKIRDDETFQLLMDEALQREYIAFLASEPEDLDLRSAWAVGQATKKIFSIVDGWVFDGEQEEQIRDSEQL
jgi:hypothetical protein